MDTATVATHVVIRAIVARGRSPAKLFARLQKYGLPGGFQLLDKSARYVTHSRGLALTREKLRMELRVRCTEESAKICGAKSSSACARARTCVCVCVNVV